MKASTCWRRTLGQQRVLHAAVEILTDEVLEQLAEMGPRDTIHPDSPVGRHLPRQYTTRYNHAFARSFLACVMTVSWKIWDSQEHRPACVGEELALEALIATAEDVLEWKVGATSLDIFRDFAFDDSDFMFLFNPKYDGIQHDPAIQQMTPMVGLDFDDWFKPWHKRWYVHPYNHRPPMRKFKPPADGDDDAPLPPESNTDG